ncbi:hypothetical protein EON66_04975, partial [archaeon]
PPPPPAAAVNKPIAPLPRVAAKGKASAPSAAAARNNLMVVVRCRPLSDKEHARGLESCVRVEGGTVVVSDPGHFADNYMRRARLRDREYTFDAAFDGAATQEAVYQATVATLLPGVMSGFNATVFAYGATGSGKTHTTLGTKDAPGIMGRTMTQLYKSIHELQAAGDRFVTVSLSYVEVYNENIRDLLAPDAPGALDAVTPSLDLREDPVHGPCVAGITEHTVASADDIMSLLIGGHKRRTVEPTAANQESSRSHAVLQIFVTSAPQRAGDLAHSSKLSLVDLAGSERAANTLNTGQRLLEGANINRSLLALGNCITALAQGKGAFVPYRDSKYVCVCVCVCVCHDPPFLPHSV